MRTISKRCRIFHPRAETIALIHSIHRVQHTDQAQNEQAPRQCRQSPTKAVAEWGSRSLGHRSTVAVFNASSSSAALHPKCQKDIDHIDDRVRSARQALHRRARRSVRGWVPHQGYCPRHFMDRPPALPEDAKQTMHIGIRASDIRASSGDG